MERGFVLNSATCFYIGDNYILTNKHVLYGEEKYKIRNRIGEFEVICWKEAEGSVDVSLGKVTDAEGKLRKVKPVEISKETIEIGSQIVAINYGLFPRVLENASFTSGQISKIIQAEGKDLLYYLDLTNYNGSS